MQPVFTQVPPNRWRSMMATLRPASAMLDCQERPGLTGADNDCVVGLLHQPSSIEEG